LFAAVLLATPDLILKCGSSCRNNSCPTFWTCSFYCQ